MASLTSGSRSRSTALAHDRTSTRGTQQLTIHDRSSNGGRIAFLNGLLIGLGVGVAAGFALAPSSGSALRRDLRTRVADARRAFRRAYEDSIATLSRAADQGRAAYLDVMNAPSATIEAAGDPATPS